MLPLDTKGIGVLILRNTSGRCQDHILVTIRTQRQGIPRTCSQGLDLYRSINIHRNSALTADSIQFHRLGIIQGNNIDVPDSTL